MINGEFKMEDQCSISSERPYYYSKEEYCRLRKSIDRHLEPITKEMINLYMTCAEVKTIITKDSIKTTSTLTEEAQKVYDKLSEYRNYIYENCLKNVIVLEDKSCNRQNFRNL